MRKLKVRYFDTKRECHFEDDYEFDSTVIGVGVFAGQLRRLYDSIAGIDLLEIVSIQEVERAYY